MKSLVARILALLFAVSSSFALAAVGGEGAALAPEPQVNVAWVYAFLVLFVVICVGIGVAIWRSERRGKSGAQGGGNAKS